MKDRNHYLRNIQLSSANAFNLVKEKILLFGKVLNHGVVADLSAFRAEMSKIWNQDLVNSQ